MYLYDITRIACNVFLGKLFRIYWNYRIWVMIWRIVSIGIGLIIFFYGANLAMEIGLETAKTSQDPISLMFGPPATQFVIALGLIALGGTLIFVGAVAKKILKSSYNPS